MREHAGRTIGAVALLAITTLFWIGLAIFCFVLAGHGMDLRSAYGGALYDGAESTKVSALQLGGGVMLAAALGFGGLLVERMLRTRGIDMRGRMLLLALDGVLFGSTLLTPSQYDWWGFGIIASLPMALGILLLPRPHEEP